MSRLLSSIVSYEQGRSRYAHKDTDTMFLFFPIPVVTRTLLISLITIFTLVGIMVRPWKTNEALIALAGRGSAGFHR